MRNKITFFTGMVMSLILSYNSVKAAVVTPFDSIYYYVSVDTSGVDIGYLRVDSFDVSRLVVDNAKGSRALWKFVQPYNQPYNNYHIINKYTGDTLRLDNLPEGADTIAVISEKGILNKWYDLFDEQAPDLLMIDRGLVRYHLTYDGEVWLSGPESTKRPMRIEIERARAFPDPYDFYKLRLDTLGMPLTSDLGYLRIDTSKTVHDSLAVDTLQGGLSLWQFTPDTVIKDTTYYKIYNKETNDLLAFDIPPGGDTIALLSDTGMLFHWLFPFYEEDKARMKFMARDTATGKNYYLGLQDTMVMLLTDTSSVKMLGLALEDKVPPAFLSYRFDSTQVYKVKYLSGQHKGLFMGQNTVGDTVRLDSVYPHIPDGQFILNEKNKNSLINRTVANVVTADFEFAIDTVTNDTIPNQYVFSGDTLEVKPISDASFDEKSATLGYKYLRPTDISAYAYYLSYTSSDSLNGRILGSDTVVKLLGDADTALFILEEAYSLRGAMVMGNMAQLQKTTYRLRSRADTTLYLSLNSPSKMTNQLSQAGTFYFKEEGATAGRHSLLPSPYQNRFLVDSVSKELFQAKTDTTAMSLFTIVQTTKSAKPIKPLEPDPYTYLTALPSGRGLYDITSVQGHGKLTKNYYDYAVLADEGESVMTRAGSYTDVDFNLWIDTAQGVSINPVKPSFYIVKDVDTTSSKLNITGYFLHVMDSAAVADNDDYVVVMGGNTYNRVNFVKAYRHSENELLLNTTARAQSKDSVGFAGKNEHAINEYRFYFQETTAGAEEYYIVTEQGYGGSLGIRGYLSHFNERLYVGPRGDSPVAPVTIRRSNPVSNKWIPPVTEEKEKETAIIGGKENITFLNASGESVVVFNIVGQPVAKRILSSDNEQISVPRGIMIVKVGKAVTRKVVVK